MGQHWSKTSQIAVVSLRDDGWTDLDECKWALSELARIRWKTSTPELFRDYVGSPNSTTKATAILKNLMT